MNEPMFRLSGIVRTFPQGRKTLEVLRGVDLGMRAGEIIALVGPSGAGKSTLLHIAGLLELPDRGEVFVNGSACSELSDDLRTTVRRKMIGFVYQYHHLLPEFSALENVVIPQLIGGRALRAARARASDLLAALGLHDRENHRPGQLSGGEQQRVAIARALANQPTVLLADEPTGNLDPHTANDVFAILLQQTREARLAAIVATHNRCLAAQMDRTIRLEDGVLVPE